jgi:hypothetical protein
MISLPVLFLQIRQEKICKKIDLVTRPCLVICLLKNIIVKAFLTKFILYFTKNIFVKTNIRPDIRYPALTG